MNILSYVKQAIQQNHRHGSVQAQFDQMARIIEGTIHAISKMVEMRDPYTAGHQKRVAKLAEAIAAEMDLPKGKKEAVRISGLVHDIGKIYIPVEFLSKPGQLTDLEFQLIKMHSQIGHDILKEIDFPWPIAEIVYQHHERIDGSGYPRGFSMDNILIESRIIGVADVVEAMSSHRPYHPALGFEIAMEEIDKGGGVIFDSDVVAACLKVLKEKGANFFFKERII